MGDEPGVGAFTGHQLDVYKLHECLGTGGMGEVCRARDTRLGRDVAIGILLHAVAADANRLARFEREARVLASLDYPNIATIRGVEGHHAVLALVMELIEGKTHADQLARGPTPLANSVRIARQIADALDAAHSTGVVHRDLKSAKVMIATCGVVKVLMALFRYTGVYRMSGTAIAYDVHPDGKRFIMISEAAGSGAAGMRRQVNVILNWLDELKQRVAPAR